jgi:hypothetical protein
MGNIEKDYIIAVYNQASQNARLHAESRFKSLSSFLTYVSILIAALAFLSSNKLPGVPVNLIGLLISCLGVIVSILFAAIDHRHHDYWEYYEGQVVRRIEKEMGIGQYPRKDDDFKKRAWFGRGLFRITATRAIYGIYLFSIVFFIAMSIIFSL